MADAPQAMNIAVIPARGGSKRIPRKNIRSFAGKPLIAYSIQAALQSELFRHVIVSTEDAEIAEIARAHGAETPFIRPAALAGDHAPTVPMVKHAVLWAQQDLGPVDAVCCIYATAPFLRSRDLRAAHELLCREAPPAYVFSCTTFSAPIQRAFRVRSDRRVEMFSPQYYASRSQDLETAYHDAGQFYWGSAGAYLSEKIFFSPESIAYVIPRYLVHDIDTAEDWTRAELVYAALKSQDGIL